MFLSYHQPSFMHRLILKKFMCLPQGIPYASVYLILGVLPFEAQRDIEIPGLFGQISICPSDQQNVRDLIFPKFTVYGNSLT